MESQFKSQLGQYRRTIEHRFSVGREKIVFRDAGWTARCQKGETAIEIAGSEDDIGLKDPEQAVFRAISRFSKSIGLNLRRRGERLKKQRR
jgi:hypothetical protein